MPKVPSAGRTEIDSVLASGISNGKYNLAEPPPFEAMAMGTVGVQVRAASCVDIGRFIVGLRESWQLFGRQVGFDFRVRIFRVGLFDHIFEQSDVSQRVNLVGSRSLVVMIAVDLSDIESQRAFGQGLWQRMHSIREG